MPITHDSPQGMAPPSLIKWRAFIYLINLGYFANEYLKFRSKNISSHYAFSYNSSIWRGTFCLSCCALKRVKVQVSVIAGHKIIASIWQGKSRFPISLSLKFSFKYSVLCPKLLPFCIFYFITLYAHSDMSKLIPCCSSFIFFNYFLFYFVYFYF